MKSVFAPILGVLLVLSVSCGEKESPVEEPSTVLATVGDREILIADLEREWERRRKLNRPVQSKEALLREMVREEVLVQQARKAGIEDEEEVQRSIRNLLIGTLKERELTSKLREVRISDDQLEAAYQSNEEKYRRDEQIHLGMIHVAVPVRASDQKLASLKARAEEALELAKASKEGFVRAAAKFSDHQASRYRGGDQGWVDPNKPPRHLSAEVLAAAKALSNGGLSDVLRTKQGFYLLKKVGTRPASLVPFEQVRPQLLAELVRQQRAEMVAAFEAEAGKDIKVSLDLDLLKEVDLKGTKPRGEVSPPPPPGP